MFIQKYKKKLKSATIFIRIVILYQRKGNKIDAVVVKQKIVKVALQVLW